MWAAMCDFWFCSCCGQYLDSLEQQPAYTLPNGDFQCSLCEVADAERDALESLEAANE